MCLQVLESGGSVSSSVLFEYRARNASSLPSSQLDWLSLDGQLLLLHVSHCCWTNQTPDTHETGSQEAFNKRSACVCACVRVCVCVLSLSVIDVVELFSTVITCKHTQSSGLTAIYIYHISLLYSLLRQSNPTGRQTEIIRQTVLVCSDSSLSVLFVLS